MMTKEQIKNELNKCKYFINTETQAGSGKEISVLCQKTDDYHYIALPAVQTPDGQFEAYDLLLKRVNNQFLDAKTALLTLDSLLPVIDGRIFQAYEQREKVINKMLERTDKAQNDDNSNEYGEGKYVVKTNQGRPNNFIYYILDLKQLKLMEIDGGLLSDELKESAPFFKYTKPLMTALKDDLNNEFEAEYFVELKKWEMI